MMPRVGGCKHSLVPVIEITGGNRNAAGILKQARRLLADEEDEEDQPPDSGGATAEWLRIASCASKRVSPQRFADASRHHHQ